MPTQLYFASLNSGSNGNCYYIGNTQDAVLIDAGISCKEIVNRMNRLGLSIGKVRAIFITHEHTDHTRGVEVFSRKYRVPVFITVGTHSAGRLWLDPPLVRNFNSHDEIPIGDLSVYALPKQHDGVDPHSFTVTYKDKCVGVFTDTGEACEHLVRHLKRCQGLFLEANYDPSMLEQGSYPYHLKKRIKGGKGHLSNRQALELFTNFSSPELKVLILSHLSEHNNHPELVYELFSKHARKNLHVEVASRHKESNLFSI